MLGVGGASLCYAPPYTATPDHTRLRGRIRNKVTDGLRRMLRPSRRAEGKTLWAGSRLGTIFCPRGKSRLSIRPFEWVLTFPLCSITMNRRPEARHSVHRERGMAGVSLRNSSRAKLVGLKLACGFCVLVLILPTSTGAAPTDQEGTKGDSPSRPASTSGRLAGNSYGISQVAYINELVRKGWTEHGLSPSPPASDSEWCRRVYLDVLGRIPSTAELDAFLRDRTGQRKLNLVNRLLGEGPVKTDEDRRLNEHYTTEYARNWTTIWTNILIGRNGGNESGR